MNFIKMTLDDIKEDLGIDFKSHLSVLNGDVACANDTLNQSSGYIKGVIDTLYLCDELTSVQALGLRNEIREKEEERSCDSCKV